MQFVPSTLLAVALVIAILTKGPLRGLPWLFAVAPLGAAAAFNMPAVGGASIGLLEFGSLVLFCVVLSGSRGTARVIGTMRPYQPGFFLALLTLYCIFATIAFPRLFEGQTEVFGVSRADNKRQIISVVLRPTTGNITQLFRIFLDVLAFYGTATLFRKKPNIHIVYKAIVVATVVNVTIGWADVLSYAVGIPEILDPIRTANYSMLVTSQMAGMKRMVGGFPEASSFGYFTFGLFAFWFRYWISNNRSGWVTLCFLATATVLLRSTSSSAYVATAVLLVMFGIFALWKSLSGRVGKNALFIALITLFAVWVLFITGFSAYQFHPSFGEFMNSTLLGKIESQSGVERMSWNSQAFKNFTDTHFFGAGLGSIRASNWLLACLGSIGAIGTGLYLLFLATIFFGKNSKANLPASTLISSLKAACLALLISAMLTIPTPDLGIFFFLLAGIIAGLSRAEGQNHSAGP